MHTLNLNLSFVLHACSSCMFHSKDLTSKVIPNEISSRKLTSLCNLLPNTRNTRPELLNFKCFLPIDFYYCLFMTNSREVL
jgi:hypothetical protein